MVEWLEHKKFMKAPGLDMKRNLTLVNCALIFALVASVARCDLPVILSLQTNGALTWTSTFTNGIAVVQTSSNLQTGSWSLLYYDLASNIEPLPVTLWLSSNYIAVDYNYHDPSNTVRTTQLPPLSAPKAFYRLAILTNPPDPTLVLHLSFDNDLSIRAILDTSGHGNHALQYSPTNWPAATTGPDGSRAGLFSGPRFAPPPHDPDYTQGDYAGIPYSPALDHLSNGTVLAWAFYDFTSYHNSTIIDNSIYGTDYGSWSLGRTYTYNTLFEIGVGNGSNGTYLAVQYPDFAPGGGSTGGWHYYGATWDGTNIVGYFDGLPISTNSQAGFPELVVGTASWTAIGCKVHAGTPQWGDPDDLPNWGWLGGKIDDVRIYKRALNPAEILSLYASFDNQPPSTPPNVRVKVDSSSQVELRWDASTDNFRVDGYRILRNGVPISTNAVAGCFVDSGLSPGASYTYALQAFDPAGNLSSQSTPIQVTTPAIGSLVEVIVDNADGPAWVTTNGGPWIVSGGAAFPNYYGADFLYCPEGASGSAIFRPRLPEAGTYSVYLWHPAGPAWYLFADNAPLDIITGGTTNTVYLDEQTNYGLWDLLGTFAFSAGTNGFVQVRPAPGASVTPADAVRFIK